MRTTTKLLLTTALSTGLVGGLVSASPAFAAGNKEKFCKATGTVTTDVTIDESGQLPEDAAADLEKGFKKLAKLAPTKKLKNATKTIAEYYGRIADGEGAEDVSEDFAKDYANATATFGTYVATKCISEVIPDITLPGGAEVEIPGLPSS